MKAVVALILTFLLTGPGDIARINSVKEQAKTAYRSGDFKTAVAKYRYLVDSLGVHEDEVLMNLSNAYFRLNDTTNALSSYQPLTLSNQAALKSQAFQQLGVMANRQGKFEDALSDFKQALKAEPGNDQARYNFEMVKKKLEEKKKQQQQKDKNKDNKDDKKDQKDQKDQKDKKDKQDQKDKKDQSKDNKDQKDKKDQKDQQNKDDKDQKKDQKDKQDQKDKKDQKDKDQKDKDKKQNEEQNKDDKNKDKKDIPPSVSDKLKDMQMSEEKAKMILEAMKNQEVQYLQQNKRKATKPKDKSKPDW